ncbi:MAG: TetR/AcrR family transcriptional regulator, transcriptional repressor for nem operon [Pseudonocardiales bacterium]|jgi:TetR/AcrR family transcriptional repressor of nem operon|nr:TetR/AcrR family transcriptional regulator, transcriptional repressor for nem operon [Pseudonocardiales bacterium]MDT7664223.1 TetR/AcrR family transcriptional regulator, transcriptional repressor for nem operon [Pseudonocardiales bacterium]MDT7678480.1 TetR/AcrR family transcriptional regulator, transcriptional repressor for nem operon [Pseudonocardiales bacterium]MDT7686453.1 TetR/AcrR family transcriptional regulator, transcriptional repressor for nem operon [Pseudonocardiales bacterium]M
MPRPSLRENVVAAAVDQFHRRGYQGSGVKDITDAAGLPKGSFYNYFGSKEDMALEALRRYGAGREMVRLQDQATPPLARLRAHFEFLQDDVARVGVNYGCMFGNFATESTLESPALRAAVHGAFAHWIESVTGALRDAVAVGELPAERDIDLLARSLVRAWEGALLHAKVLSDRGPMDDFFTGTFEPLLGIQPAGEPR